MEHGFKVGSKGEANDQGAEWTFGFTFPDLLPKEGRRELNDFVAAKMKRLQEMTNAEFERIVAEGLPKQTAPDPSEVVVFDTEVVERLIEHLLDKKGKERKGTDGDHNSDNE